MTYNSALVLGVWGNDFMYVLLWIDSQNKLTFIILCFANFNALPFLLIMCHIYYFFMFPVIMDFPWHWMIGATL